MVRGCPSYTSVTRLLGTGTRSRTGFLSCLPGLERIKTGVGGRLASTSSAGHYAASLPPAGFVQDVYHASPYLAGGTERECCYWEARLQW